MRQEGGIPEDGKNREGKEGETQQEMAIQAERMVDGIV